MSTDQYDPNVAADHTGMTFRHLPGQEKRDPFELFRNPKIVDCKKCGSEGWRVFADDSPHSGLMVLQCRKCKGYSKAIEPHKPQADDHRAKAMGLYVPNAMNYRDEMDVEGDWG